MKVKKMPFDFCIILLILEFIASLYEPEFFKVFGINLALFIIQIIIIAIKNSNDRW